MRPQSSRTGTAQWRRVRQQRLEHDRENGVTNCKHCGVWLDYDRSRLPNSAEPDHIIPHSQGGTDTFDNTRTICRLCNQRLGGKVGAKRSIAVAQKVEYRTVIEW